MKLNTHPIRLALSGAAFFCAALTTSAQISSEAAEVLDRSIEAAGGEERLKEIDSMKMVGTMKMPAMGMEIKMTTIQVYPDKGYFEQEIPGMGKMVQAYSGDTGWANNPMQGFHMMSEEELQAQKQNRMLRDMLDYEKLFESAERVEDQENMAVLKIELESGQEETHYYNKETGHLEKMEMMADMGPQGAVPATMTMAEMKEQDGLVFPKKMTMNAGGMEMEMDFTTIEVNPEVDPSIFAPPQ